MNWLMTDMDSFFASVEQHLRPELRGLPVGIVPLESDHTCLIAASYEAKKHGAKTGTKVRDAREICPGLVLIKARPATYVEVHRAILRSIDKVAPVEKVYSIDEWTIKLTAEYKHPDEACRLALRLKQQLAHDFSPFLTCSIGIAPSRLLAKIACGLEKPDGLTILSAADPPGRLEHLPLSKLTGIGKGMLARLELHNIHSVRDLWNISRDEAIRIWGSVTGARWWAGFHGEDEPEQLTRRRMMSHGNVLDPAFRTEAGAHGILQRLVCKLGQRLRQSGYIANALHLRVKDTRSRETRLEVGLPGVDDTHTLMRAFEDLWQTRQPGGAPPKQVEVSVSGLVLATQISRPLFDEVQKRQRVSQAMDRINLQWGPSKVYVGSVHNYRQHMENKIAFGRIPRDTD
ncbi:DNA-directed DNA polymerase [Planctopirus limnophila DSM 3776]|uniref:DNA-directed DNA polymerase n=1 Tax=Planctopirus limnophila (strain ATCC 43296 / DSM 3776 / IFAM 1008 / Mu 290) TaxID=521674 RepID=D5SP01_PLAL2|nr:type VI secretion protein ImpB [Planctopirus limnophila]ADG66156.1 DNA-directed DNA polymerase [Planctopirus limnophila DSM 3776]